MKATLINKYDRDGRTQYVYMVDASKCTADEIADYQLTKGEYYRHQDGNPLHFTSSFEGNNVHLVKGKTYVKNGNLVDGFKAISSEDFELKRSEYRKTLNPVDTTARPVRRMAVNRNAEI